MAVEYDLNTGQPVKSGQVNTTDFRQTGVSGPQSTVSDTTGISRTQGTQQTVQSINQLNTTPAILAALEASILQMSDRPAISQAELDRVAPLATSKFFFDSRTGQGVQHWILPNGMQVSEEQAKRFNVEQTAKREQIQQQGGVIKGGTADQRAVSEARLLEINRNRETQGKYTKEAAFADAKELTNYFSRVLTEQQLPGLLRGAEGSGASQGTARALLTQQAIQRNTEVAAKTGLDAATAYGQVNNQLAATLEALTRQDPNGVAAQLLQAINISKGIVQSGTTNSTTVTDQTTKSNQQTTQQQSGKVETINKDFLEDPVQPLISNLGQPRDNYTPISLAGTGYVQADPIINDRAPSAPENFGTDDNNFFFEGD